MLTMIAYFYFANFLSENVHAAISNRVTLANPFTDCRFCFLILWVSNYAIVKMANLQFYFNSLSAFISTTYSDWLM